MRWVMADDALSVVAELVVKLDESGSVQELQRMTKLIETMVQAHQKTLDKIEMSRQEGRRKTSKAANDRKAADQRAAHKREEAEDVRHNIRTTGNWKRLVADNKAKNAVMVRDNAHAKKLIEQQDRVNGQTQVVQARHTAKITEQAHQGGIRQRLQNIAIAARSAAQVQRAADWQALEATKQRYRRENLAARDAMSQRHQAQRQADRLQAQEQRASDAKSLARNQAFMRAMQSVWNHGLMVVTNAIRNHGVRRNSAIRHEQNMELATVQQGIRKRVSAQEAGMQRENAVLSRGAQKQLAITRQAQAEQAQVIRRGTVKSDAAAARATQLASTGAVGLATGRSTSPWAMLGAGAIGGISAAAIFGPVAEYQQTQIAFEGILGSAQKADAFLSQMRDFAAKTPFELPGLLTSAKMLLATGTAAKDVVPVMTTIGNAASNLGVGADGIESVVRALGQMKGKGKASAEELNQISEAMPGFSAVAAIAKNMGITTGEAMALMQKGFIKADEAIPALLKGMQEMRGAQGAMDRQSATLNGRISTFKDTLRNLLIDGLLPVIAFLAPMFGKLTEWMDSLINGKGAWEIVRNGLLGIAAGMAAILLVKGAVQVVKLLGTALSALAAHPLLLVAAAFGALAGILIGWARHNKTIQTFFEHMKNWVEVGYIIKAPIKGLSLLTLVLTSIGAGARVMVDSVKTIKSALMDFFGGRFDKAVEKLRGVWDKLFETMRPAGEAVSKWLQKAIPVAVAAVAGFVSDVFKEAIPKAWKTVREFFGALFTGKTGGAWFGTATEQLALRIRDLIGAAFTKAKEMIGGIGDFFKALFTGTWTSWGNVGSASENLAIRIHDVIAKAFAIVSGGAQGFITGLFDQKKGAGDNKAAVAVGERLRGLVEAGMAKLGELGGKIGDLFVTKIGPAILKGLYKLGEWLGGPFLSTVLSEPVLTALLAVTAALAAAAGALLLGFIRGLLTTLPRVLTSLRHIGDKLFDALLGAVKNNGIATRMVELLKGTFDLVFKQFALAFDFMGALWDAIGAGGDSAKRNKALKKMLSLWLEGLGNIGSFAKTLWRAFGSLILDGLPALLGMLSKIPQALGKWISGLGDKVGGPMGGFVKMVLAPFEFLAKEAGTILKFLGDWLGGMGDIFGSLFRGDFGGVLDGMKRVWGAIYTFIKSTFGNLGGLLGDLLVGMGKMLFRSLTGAIDWVVGSLPGLLTRLNEWVASIPKMLGNAASGAFDWLSEAAGKAVLAAVDWFKTLPDQIGKLWLAVAGGAAKIGSAVVGGLLAGMEAIVGKAGDFGNALYKAFASIWNKVAKLIESGLQIGVNVLDKALGPTVNFGDNVTEGIIPRLPGELAGSAHGRIVRHKMLSWLGEDGPEVVIPLTKPARARELMAQSGLAGGKVASLSPIDSQAPVMQVATPGEMTAMAAYANGTSYVPGDGPAYLHRGEAVIASGGLSMVAKKLDDLASAIGSGRDAPLVGTLQVVETVNARETAAQTVARLRSHRFLHGASR